jgi:aquaporin Z
MTQLSKAVLAEALGTFVLVLGGCGSAVFAAGIANVGIGFLGVSFAFGLSVLIMAYAFSHISGAHFNPAVTIGLATAGRFEMKHVPHYIIAQVLGAILAAAFIAFIAGGRADFMMTENGLAVNGVGALSPQGYNLVTGFVAEVVLTAIFLWVILGSTDSAHHHGKFAPIAIGLALTLIHLISIPITNTSVNPARSTGPALIVGGQALAQLWIFWLAPVIGGILGAISYKLVRVHPHDAS